MYLEIFLADFAVFRVFGGISRDFAEIPEFRGSATARNIRSPVYRWVTPLKEFAWLVHVGILDGINKKQFTAFVELQ